MKRNEDNLHNKHKTHRNVLYGLVFVLVVMQMISFISISSQITRVNSKLLSVKEDLELKLKDSETKYNSILETYNQENQRNLNDISKLVLTQESNFKQEITLLKSERGDFTSIINDVVKGVVSVGTDKGVGTGFLVSKEGYIVTNQHVIANALKIAVLTNDKNVVPAKLVGEDVLRDIAILKIDGNYPYLEFKNSDEVKTGNKVIAIGNPLGLSFTVTEGIISALDRSGPNGLTEYVQTDVSLNPGNSGGPLIDTSGKVIGVNNFKVGGAENIGFALESNVVKQVANNLANQTIIP